ncbi:MAG: DEAD/DEAH box helicase [Gaiellales bacterium]
MQETFGAVGVSERVVVALRKRGLTAPFRIQELVLKDAIAGRDVLARSPTGSGKTLAFAIPIAERLDPNTRGPGALVLVPTRELARQVTDELAPLAHARGLRVAEVYGGVGIDLQARRAANAHCIVATPGRLEDLMARRLIRLDAVKILVLDEADRMLDLGFQPAVDRILSVLPRERQTMFFSATLDGVVAKHAERSTRDPLRVEAELPVDQIGDVAHQFLGVERDDKIEALVKLLATPDRDLALVFVRTKRGAARLARRLEQRGLRAGALHGDMSQSQRQRSLKNFENGRIDTLVATDVAARGLDVDAITHVINFDPPADAVAYTHRVGRTGRAGRSGTGITLVLPDEREDITKLADAADLGTELDLAGLRQHKAAPSRNGGRRGGGGGQNRRRRPAAA